MPATLAASPAEMLLNRLRSRGVTLRVDGANLLASPRSALTDLDRETIREHKPELLAWLAAPDDPRAVAPDPPASAPIPTESTSQRMEADWLARFRPAPAPWDVQAAALIDWFESHRDALPCEPFKLSAFADVTDPPKFYAALALDIRDGPNGPRAAGLVHELQRLREMF